MIIKFSHYTSKHADSAEGDGNEEDVFSEAHK